MINLLKGGLLFSDRISTISEQYTKDIQSENSATVSRALSGTGRGTSRASSTG